MNKPAKIFYDRAEIHTGQKWPAVLKKALAHSRCLVGIWNPLYFHSDWCQSECAIMRHREEQLGYGTVLNPDGLVIGVRVNDGDYFPKFAKISQYGDFEPYYVECAGFRESPLYVDFEKAIVPLARDVARIALGVPPWSSAWLAPEWSDDIIAKVQKPSIPKAPQPLIEP